MNLNTKINYLYRDAYNCKMYNECVINGNLSLKQQKIIFGCLDNGKYFIPSKVGLPEKCFEGWIDDADHIWFELSVDSFEDTDAPANVSITSDELVSAFCQCKDKWEEVEKRNTKELYIRLISAEICDVFEELLDEYDITIPCNDREGNDGEARIYGEVYSKIEADVTDILAKLCEEVKASPDVAINMEDYNGFVDIVE